MDLGKVQERQFNIQITFDRLFLIAMQTVPLIDCNDQSTTCIHNKTKQVGILFTNPLPGIEHHDHHMSIRNRLQGFNNTELFNMLLDPCAAPHTGRIDQGVELIIFFKWDIDTVTRCPRHIENNYPLFTEDTIHQRRLPNIGTTNNGNLYPLLFFVLFNLFGKGL